MGWLTTDLRGKSCLPHGYGVVQAAITSYFLERLKVIGGEEGGRQEERMERDW